MTDPFVSRLPDADMQAVPRALLRAARSARDLARRTGTAVVLMRDGELIEDAVGEAQPMDPGRDLEHAQDLTR